MFNSYGLIHMEIKQLAGYDRSNIQVLNSGRFCKAEAHSVPC